MHQFRLAAIAASSFLAMTLPTVAQARQFMLAGSGVSNDVAVLLDLDTFKFVGANKVIAAIYVYGDVPAYPQRLMEVVQTEVDCAGRRMRDLSGRAYNLKGGLSASYDTPRPWIAVDRDSLAERVVETLCIQGGTHRAYEHSTAYDAAVHVRKMMDDYRRGRN